MKYTWVLIVVLLLLGAVYFVFEKKGAEKPAEEGVFQTFGENAGIEASQVNRVRLYENNVVVTLVQSDGSWRIEEPIKTIADSGKVKDLISNILDNPIHRILTKEETGGPSEYGLDKSEQKFYLGTESKSEVSAQIGDTSVTGSDFYLYVSEKDIMLAAIQLKEKLVFNPEYYRTKNPLQFDIKAVTSVAFTYPDSRVRFEYRPEKKSWVIAEPEFFNAKNSKVELLLSQLQRMEIVKFLGERLTGEKKHSLDKAPIRIEIALGKDKVMTLELGDTDVESNGIFARTSEVPDEDVIVEASIQQKLMVNVSDFREDSLFQVDPANIKTLDVRERGAENLSIMQDELNKWKMLSPTTGDIDQAKLKDFFRTLSALRPRKYISSSELARIDENMLGFDSYKLKVVIKTNDDSENLEITIGNEIKKSGYYIKATGMNEACIVDSALVKAFIDANSRLKSAN